jgi:hypothetical protein
MVHSSIIVLSQELTLLATEGSHDSTLGTRERRYIANITHARMLQLQELRLATIVTNTLDNESELQGFAEASKS